MSAAGKAAALRADPEFAALLAASARLGRDPLQVQAAGGNASLKRDGVMWVKASGTWLSEAGAREIMAPIRQAEMAAALAAGEAAEGAAFLIETGGPALRPSIETAMHAAFAQPVALHTHCVETLAVAIREDGAAEVRAALEGLDPIALPYVMPGLPLARALAAEAGPGRDVAALGNHGLIACGATVAEAEARLRAVSARLAARNARPAEAAPDAEALSSARYRPADAPALHAVARDPARLAMAAGGPYYPDHVVFLGPRLAIAEAGEAVEAAAERLSEAGAPPTLVMLPGAGAALRRDASAAQEAMARCLGDVIGRVPAGAALRPLPEAEIAALLGWDAEKHRQAMSAGR